MTDDMQAPYNLKFVTLTTAEIVSTSRSLPKFKLTRTHLATVTGNASTLKKNFMKICALYIKLCNKDLSSCCFNNTTYDYDTKQEKCISAVPCQNII